MDLVGVAMGFVTVPMAVLSIASAVATIVLLASGDGPIVLVGVCGFGIGLLIAWAFERLAMLLDAHAWAILRRSGRPAARPIAMLSAALPMVAVIVWQLGCFAVIGGRGPAAWMFSYGVATGPWTLFAALVGSDRRTLSGIRAYAGHLGYWLFSALVLIGVPLGVAAWSMFVPAMLPLTVGTLLAVADREALRNVRI